MYIGNKHFEYISGILLDAHAVRSFLDLSHSSLQELLEVVRGSRCYLYPGENPQI